MTVRRCSGCGRCVAACPERIITLASHHHRKRATVAEADRCTHCDRCVVACPLLPETTNRQL
jgi:Fe-S-cluster-containing hydrogenase component 2